jgi:hypothetical protein
MRLVGSKPRHTFLHMDVQCRSLHYIHRLLRKELYISHAPYCRSSHPIHFQSVRNGNNWYSKIRQNIFNQR